METYIAFAIYVGMLFLIASGGIIWMRLRKDIKRFFGLRHYHEGPNHQTRMF